MYVYANNFQWASREDWNIRQLPGDLMHLPVVMDDPGVSLNHSKSTGLFYVLQEVQPRTGEEIYFGLLTSGHWLDCYDYISNPYFLNVPFEWGKRIKNRYGLVYVPIWESVLTGEIWTDEEGYEHEQTKEIYKIIRLSVSPFEDDNVYQRNNLTSFEVFSYDTDLRQMVSDLECFTGIKF